MPVLYTLRRLALSSFLDAVFIFSFATTAIFAEDGCALDTVHITQISQAMNIPACRKNKFLEKIPDLRGQQLKAFDVSFTPSTTVFGGETRPIIIARQIGFASAEWVRSEVLAIIRSNIPPDSCEDISAGGVAYSILGGALVAEFDVRVQANVCTHSVCVRGWGTILGVPAYPILERCTAKVAVPGAKTTLGVRAVISPLLVSTGDGKSTIQVKIVPTTFVKEGVSDLLKNIVGFFTFGIGSKAIQDKFDHELGDFKGKLPTNSYSVASLDLPKARPQGVDIPFVLQQPYFQTDGSELVLAVGRIASVKRNVACGIRTQAIEANKFFESCINPQRQYTVQTNDSLWSIAQQIYGEGQYYHLLQQRNGMRGSHPILEAGQILTVTPYFEIEGEDEVVVSSGDTLWDIAKIRLGDPLLYRQLLNDNKKQVHNPNKMSTLVVLKTK